jgi:uncharacterized membrane protein (DUF106 family)
VLKVYPDVFGGVIVVQVLEAKVLIGNMLKNAEKPMIVSSILIIVMFFKLFIMWILLNLRNGFAWLNKAVK